MPRLRIATKLAISGLGLVITTQLGFAQMAIAETADILQKALTAYGGDENISRLGANLTVVGQEAEGQTNSPYRLLRHGAKWRLDHDTDYATNNGSNLSNKGFSEGFNTEEAWIARGKKAQDLNLPTARLLNLETTAPGSFLLEALRAISQPDLSGPISVEQLPDANYQGVPVHVLQFKSKSGSDSFEIYLDQRNYMMVALTFKDINAAGQQRNVAIEYAEYKPTNNSMYPQKILRKIDGQIAVSRTVADISSIELKDMEFDRPGGSQHLNRSIDTNFEYAHKEILVKCRLNQGEEIDFLFDTGASETIIDRRVALDNGLVKQGEVAINAINGSITTNTTSIDRLEVGSLILNDVEARIMDLSGQSRHLGRRLGGIIGTNVISRFVTVIDYGKSRLSFHDADTYPRPVDAAQLTFTKRSAPVVKIRLNNAFEQAMLVDTGAAFNNLPAQVAQRFAATGQPGATIEGTGLDGRPVRLGKVTIDNVGIGNGNTARSLKRVDFTYTQTTAQTAKKDNQGFFQSDNLGILGNPFLENFLVYIDYKFQRLLLKPSNAVRTKSEVDQGLVSGDRELVQKRDFRAAELSYNKALMAAQSSQDKRNEAAALGRLGNLRRIMAKDLNRPEHLKAAYDYYVRGQALAKKIGANDVEGRILADWSLLYLEQGQAVSAKQTMDRAAVLAPNDPNVNVDYAVHLSRTRQFSDMQRYIDKALFLEPSNWQALWYQVKLAETFSDAKKYQATLKDILRFYPASRLAQDKLKQMESQSSSLETKPSP
ncbi:MAG: aspartyl protease family protein [Candidatus Melainabacteria bacterium]|nr:aspartyl protease family protein [Candidatus Melainabacteria bacterium]MBX9671801.1 aspartyl protease family protein [Candidatus Obscuribacterales bacterium]